MNNEVVQLDIEHIIKAKAPKFSQKIPSFVYRFMERIICQEQMNHILRVHADKQGVDFADALLKELDIELNVIGVENIPTQGRFTFASNHPLGGLDGVGLVSVFGPAYNNKIKFVVNDLLMFVKPLAPVFLPINKHGGQAKDAADILNKSYEGDDQLLVFPAGLVSRLQKGGIIKDLEWKKSFIAKTIQYERDIVPIYFEGRNTSSFYRIARWRKQLGIKFNIEMMLLPSQLFKSRGSTFNVYVGKPISWQTFDKSKSMAQWAAHLKEVTYSLKQISKK